MKADLTRDSFDPLKHFSRVVMQQGRVQLDADWNEQTGILLHAIRQLAGDIFGAGGSPNGGFTPTLLPNVTDDFEIAAGAYYVDGILCEADASPVAVLSLDVTKNTIVVAQWTTDETSYQVGQYLRLSDNAKPPNVVVGKIAKLDYATRALTFGADTSLAALTNAPPLWARRLLTYLTQPDLPNPAALKALPAQLYLDVWERLITPLEDDSIREVALDGVDTADRARVVWQVKAAAFPGGNKGTSCLTAQQLADSARPGIPGLLRARVQPGAKPTDPCTVPPDARYRGAENQLYRVEVNTGSNDPAGNPPSFKWSRDNGAAVFPVLEVKPASTTTTVTLDNLGRDERFGLAEGDFVEIQDDQSVLNQLPAQLLQVESIDRGRKTVVLAGTPGTTVGTVQSLHPLLRRWDYGAGLSLPGGPVPAKDGAALIQPGTLAGGDAAWLTLEDGVQILFEDINAVSYRTGDYWLIPARVATRDVLWPQETALDAQGQSVTNPVAKPPDGIVHHYAPLAILAAAAGGLKITPCAPAKKP